MTSSWWPRLVPSKVMREILVPASVPALLVAGGTRSCLATSHVALISAFVCRWPCPCVCVLSVLIRTSVILDSGLRVLQ